VTAREVAWEALCEARRRELCDQGVMAIREMLKAEGKGLPPAKAGQIWQLLFEESGGRELQEEKH